MSKQILSLTLSVFVIAALFVGCSSDAVGKYQVKTIDGMTVEDCLAKEAGVSSLSDADVQEFLNQFGINSLEEMITVELNSDHSCSMRYLGVEKSNGTWSQSGDTIKLGTLTTTYHNGELTITIDGMTVVMSKMK